MTRRFRYVLADVFTDRAFAGNPLAVFPDARGLEPPEMQAIARELNLSESVFLTPADEPGHTRRARIFTPATELPFAGHPTVGAAVVLAETGEIEAGGAATDIVLEEAVGPVPVHIEWNPGAATRATLSVAQLPEAGPVPDDATLAATLGLPIEQIAGSSVRAAAWSAGVPFSFVPLRDVAALAAVQLDVAAWREGMSGAWGSGLYVIAMADWQDGREVMARMFAPAMGMTEDPATGAAAAALAGLLADNQTLPDGTTHWRVRQGEAMGRPSVIELSADIRDGRPTAVRIGGGTVIVASGDFLVPG